MLSLQLKKLRRHNKSAIDLSNANPARGHKEVRRSTGHITVTARYEYSKTSNRIPNRDSDKTLARSNQPRTRETYGRRDDVFGYELQLVPTVWSAVSISESELLQATEETISRAVQPTKLQY